MPRFAAHTVVERVFLFLFEGSTAWIDRMMLDDERLDARTRGDDPRPAGPKRAPPSMSAE